MEYEQEKVRDEIFSSINHALLRNFAGHLFDSLRWINTDVVAADRDCDPGAHTTTDLYRDPHSRAANGYKHTYRCASDSDFSPTDSDSYSVNTHVNAPPYADAGPHNQRG